MKPKDTIVQLKSLIGLRYSDPEVQAMLPNFVFPIAGGPNDEILITVTYMNEKKAFTPERLVAMALADLKIIAEQDQGSKVTDAVISIPVFFTDAQRRAMLDAASIAQLNVLRLMHETTATALAYGIFKTNEFTDTPTNVVFVDVGHSAMQACVVRFTKSQLRVMSTGFDRKLGGHAFDLAMFDHFCEEFGAKHKIDIKSNARASLRLKIAIEKMKKILSANPEAPMSVECIMDEVDVKSSMTREKMEELSQGLLEKLMGPVTTAMSEAGLVPDDIAAVELVGNASRMPFISAQLEAFFGQVPGRTLNASECVARGCALQGAMLSPQFKVRDFEVVDSFPYPVSFAWASEDGEAKELEIFERNNAVPSSKMMTFFRDETFTIQAKYTTPTLLPPGTELAIGSFDIGPIARAKDAEEKTKLKVKVRLNLNGLVSVEQAQAIEEIEEEVVVEPPPAPPAAKEDEPMADAEKPAAEDGGAEKMDADAAPAAPVVEKKKKVKKTDVNVVSVVGGLPSQVLETFVAEEYEMALQDRVMEETKERKNAVEEYVYRMRSQIADKYAPFVEPAVAEAFNATLNATEDWLYEDGEDETKGVYVSKLAELKAVGDPIEARHAEETLRPPACDALRAAASGFLSQAAPDPAHEHIDAADLEKVRAEAQAALDWLSEKEGLQAAAAKTADPVLVSNDVVKKREGLERMCAPILSRPKPKPPPPPAPEPEAAEAKDADADAGAAAGEGEGADGAAADAMDVDAEEKPAAGAADDLD
jgi:heat shock protein 4